MKLKLATMAILATFAYCGDLSAADANGVSLKVTGVAVVDDTEEGRNGGGAEFLPPETRVVVPSDKQLALFRVEYDVPTNFSASVVLEPNCDRSDLTCFRYPLTPSGPRRGAGAVTKALGLRGAMYDKGLLLESVRLSYIKTDDDGVNTHYSCDVPVDVLFAKDGENKTDGIKVVEPLPPPPAKSLSLLPGWTEDFKAAKAQAEKEGKLVLAYFLDSRSGDDGKPKKVLDHEVLGSEEFLKRAGESYVCFMVELHTPSQSWTAFASEVLSTECVTLRRCGRVNPPEVAILHPNGTRVALLDKNGWEGGVDGYLAKIDNARKAGLEKLKAKYKALEEAAKKVAPKTDACGADLDAKSAEVCRRMKAIVLPEMEFKPPATLADAVGSLRNASIDHDNPEIPKEERGFSFILAMGDGDAPALPEIKMKDIRFYDALKIVCEAVRYQFVVENGIVVVKPGDEAKK